MLSYANGGKRPDEQFFGFQLSSARMVIDCTFRKLKARFRYFRWDMNVNLEKLPAVIHYCFISLTSTKVITSP